jgi:hypothetical protein
MNPLTLLTTAFGLAVFPGLVYTGVTALLAGWAGRFPSAAASAGLGETVTCVGVAAAGGMLALPGSPLAGIPGGFSIAGILGALTAGVAWGTPRRWPWHRLIAAAAVLAPLLGMVSAAGSLDAGTLAVAAHAQARLWAAAAALLALPALVRPFDGRTPRLTRAVLWAAAALFFAVLAGSGPLAALPSPWVALICALIAVVSAALVGLLRGPLRGAAPILGVMALAPAATALTLLYR